MQRLDARHKEWLRIALKKIGKTTADTESVLLKRLLSLGVDLSTRSAVKSFLTLMDADTDLADTLYIKIANELNRRPFAETDFKDRALFLPQCLRNVEKCKATMGEYGWECKQCGQCSIAEIKKEADKLGYKVYVVPGGSMVARIIGANGVKGVVGVGCNFELCEAAEKLAMTKIWGQGVPLLKDGCKDTVVNVNEVKKMLRVKD